MDLQQRSMITSEEVYQDLCRKIENLEYMPGTGISENELCALYHTSRHVVRGAFAMLKQRKLMEVYPQRGSFVSLIDMNFIADIIYTREAIEQEAIQRVLDQDGIVDEVCKKMRECISLQKTSVKEKIPNDDYYRLDEQFHGYILEAAGKKGIMKMLEDSYIHFRRWRNLELRSMMRVNQLIEQHEAIVDNLEKRDRLAVRKSMHVHLDTVDLFHDVCEKTKNEYFYKQ